MDASEWDSRRWTDRQYLLLTFPKLSIGGGLLVPYSLPGPPVVKQLMQIVTREPGQVGGFSQCTSPNISTESNELYCIKIMIYDHEILDLNFST